MELVAYDLRDNLVTLLLAIEMQAMIDDRQYGRYSKIRQEDMELIIDLKKDYTWKDIGHIYGVKPDNLKVNVRRYKNPRPRKKKGARQ